METESNITQIPTINSYVSEKCAVHFTYYTCTQITFL